MEPVVGMGREVGDQPGPWMIRAGFGGAGPMHAARSLGAEMERSKSNAKADIKSALCCKPVKVEERETRSSAYPISETRVWAVREVGMLKWWAGSVWSSSRRAMSKNAVHAWGWRRPPAECPAPW